MNFVGPDIETARVTRQSQGKRLIGSSGLAPTCRIVEVLHPRIAALGGTEIY